MAAGLFRRRIDVIVSLWLCISLLNELALGSVAIRKIFLNDISGFFATGLLIYQLYLGRRDVFFQTLLALSVACAVGIQAIYNLGWLRDHTGRHSTIGSWQASV